MVSIAWILDISGFTFYNEPMPDFHFSYPIEVRFGDLDPLGHVNNANFLTYFEQTRINYLVHLGLFNKGQSFLEVGIILADAHITYLAPVLFGMDVRIHVGVTRLGNKSMTMEYLMIDNANRSQLATASIVLVTYDYHKGETIPIPDLWREKIRAFEHL
jgi:acyl-CoA thioester hydrolase